MSFPKRVFPVAPRRGFISDTPAHEAGPDFYTLATNVHFRDGFAERILGNRLAYTTALATASPVQLLHALNAEVSDTNYWLLFEADGTAWAIEGTNASQIDNSLLQATTQPFEHSSALLNGLPVYSNGSDEPVYWAGGNLVTLPDWTATETCQFIAVFKFHIFAMNISGPAGTFPNLVKWSSAAEPGTVPNSWTPAATNDAGDVELADSPGAVLCAYPLRDTLVFYKRSSMYTAQFVGGNNVFSFRKVQSASGALTPRSVCDVNGQHFVVSDGDILLTDGTNRRSIGEARVKDWLFNQLDQDNYRNLFCTYNRGRDEVLIAFPTAGNQFCNLGLVYDMNRDSFGVRELAGLAAAPVGFVNDAVESNTWADRASDTWDSAVDPWGSSTIAAARDSIVHVDATTLRQQDTGDAVAVGASLGKHSMHFGEPERIKYIRKVHIRARQDFGTLLVRVGGQMTPTGPIAWSQERAVTAPDQVVNVQAIGRYISVEVRSNSTEVWKITGLDLEGEMRGYY